MAMISFTYLARGFDITASIRQLNRAFIVRIDTEFQRIMHVPCQ